MIYSLVCEDFIDHSILIYMFCQFVRAIQQLIGPIQQIISFIWITDNCLLFAYKNFFGNLSGGKNSNSQPFVGVDKILEPLTLPNKPWFLCVFSTSHLKTLWEKKSYEQFLLFPHCFLTIWKTFCNFHPI